MGNAILYETVLAIMNIQSESGLRVLAVNILGKFLSNKDNNIRYVALNTLLKTVNKDNNAVQRHRKIIVDCLRDHDISIRRRALELTFALVNESNVRVLVRELLVFLEKADKEFKPLITSEITIAAHRHAPNKRWEFDTYLRVLKVAGNYVRDDNLSGFIRLIITTPELHVYAVHKLYQALKEDVSQDSLVYAALWAIGEYGNILVSSEPYGDDDEEKETVTEAACLNVIESVLANPFVTTAGREYAITALVKLSTRFPNSVQRIKSIIERYRSHLNLEIQQRSNEFHHVLNHDSIRPALLERMPPPEEKIVDRKLDDTNGSSSKLDVTVAAASVAAAAVAASVAPSASSKSATQSNNLLDIDLLGDAPATAPATAATATPASFDPLADLLGGAPSSKPAASAPASSNDLLDLLALGGGAPAAPVAVAAFPSQPTSFIGYDKNGLKVSFAGVVDSANPAMMNITATFFNASGGILENLVFQAAVPKSLKIQLQPPSSTTIPRSGTVTQLIRVLNPTKEKIRLRIKISFSLNGQNVDDVAEVSNFPAM